MSKSKTKIVFNLFRRLLTLSLIVKKYFLKGWILVMDLGRIMKMMTLNLWDLHHKLCNQIKNELIHKLASNQANLYLGNNIIIPI